MDRRFAGLLVFVVAYLAGRIINERAIRRLGDDEKTKLIDGFSKYRVLSVFGVAGLVLAHFVLRSAIPNSYFGSISAFLVMIVVYLLGVSVWSYRRLRRLGISDGYINQFLLSTFVQYLGIFVLFGFIVTKE